MLILFACAANANELRSIQVTSRGDAVTLRVRTSGPPVYSTSSLTSPDRLVFDLRDTQIKRAKPAGIAGGGAVKKVRWARWQAHDVRIVVDLQRAARSSRSIARAGEHDYVLKIEILPHDARGVVPTRPSISADIRSAQPSIAPLPEVQAAAHAPLGARSLVIAVDAGHGGEDPGATGASGTREKNVVLAIARTLSQQINDEPGMKAVLTRDGDYFVPLRERMVRARKNQADLFVSIHADSIRDRSVAGASVYTLSQRGASDEASRWLAERENAADLLGGVKLGGKDDVLKSVLLDLSQTAALSASQNAAARVLQSLDQIGDVRKHRVQQARFVVLKSPDIPSMLVETAYISNPAEERRLGDPAYQQKIAAAVRAGLREYFYSNPPPGSQMAQIAVRPHRAGG